MFIKNGKIGFPSSCLLIAIHASSGRQNSCEDSGDSSPLTDLLTPIVHDGPDALNNMVILG